VQYYAPLYRHLAKQVDLTVFYAYRDTLADQSNAGFGTGFSWDVDLLTGYRHQFLDNVSRQPGLGSFSGVDTPGIGAELGRGRFDGVLIMGWYLKAFIQALVAARRAGIPAMARGDSQLGTPRSRLKSIAKELMYPLFLRQFGAALTVGQRNRSYWQHYRYPQARMFDSPHCVDTAWFAARATPQARAAVRQRMGIAAQAPVVLFAGKLLPFKRPLDVVRGAVHARALGIPVEVLVAGSGPLQRELHQCAEALAVPLHQLGFCNQTEMPPAYAAADVLVLPSTGRETWGLVANEALACGRALLLSDAVGSALDLAGDGTTGKVFPLADTQALGSAMAELLIHPPQPAALAARSQAHSLAAAADGVLAALSYIQRDHKRAVNT